MTFCFYSNNHFKVYVLHQTYLLSVFEKNEQHLCGLSALAFTLEIKVIERQSSVLNEVIVG